MQMGISYRMKDVHKQISQRDQVGHKNVPLRLKERAVW